MRTTRHARIAMIAALAALTCAPAFAQDTPLPAAADTPQPEGWDAEVRMAEAVDDNPDPNIVEFTLEAKIQDLEFIPGKMTPAWTYNGTLPGPLLRAKVGDRLIVHFKNSLPEATTIHWHGIRVPNNMDGAPGLTQDPIEPGEEFTYDFTLDDAGLYWYHPHFNSAAQVARGLYGAIVVEDPAEPDFGDELIVILSDISLNPDGSLTEPDRGDMFGDLFGREGDTILFNGKVLPTLRVQPGNQQRWRVINAAITRYFPIALREHRWVRIGGDGGLIEHAEELPRLVLAPAERADLIFTPVGEPGSTASMGWLPVDRGWGTAVGTRRVPVLNVETLDLPAVQPAPAPAALRTIEPIDITGAEEQTVELTIQLSDSSKPMMGINHIANDYMLEARAGETQVWNVVNNSDFDHPFHLHGFFFQVLDDSRTPEWKDTVNVRNHTTTRIAVHFDDRPGMWMYHCHILDHQEAGMMGHLHVRNADGSPAAPMPESHSMHAH